MTTPEKSTGQTAVARELEKEFTILNGRPVPKEPLNYFQYKQGNRLFVNVVDSIDTWQKDLPLAERLFADMVIFPTTKDAQAHDESIVQVRDILKQRMKYPGVKENPDLLAIAKTWILPQKIHLGTGASEWVSIQPDRVKESITPLFEQLKVDTIHVLKIELANGGERPMLYTMLDAGFRPGLLLVKWSHDLDDHVATAHCAGHVLNSGYSLVSTNEQYALYMFTEQTLYDICSMKKTGLQNPILATILESATSQLSSPTDSTTKPEASTDTVTQSITEVADTSTNSSA